MNDIHKVSIQVRAPKGTTFPGEVAEGYYCVADGAVVLTDEHGKPTGDAKHHLGPGQDARGIACMLVRRRQRNGKRVRGFNDKLVYPKTKF
jgi:hypothetical protein